MAKKTVFLTGASGTMGYQSFKEFMKHRDKYNLVLLLRKSEKNEKMFKDYLNDPCVKIVWGDLANYEDVLKCVTGADYVLHVGGMVSPSAEQTPQLQETLLTQLRLRAILMLSRLFTSVLLPKQATETSPSTGAEQATPSKSAFMTTMLSVR